MIKLKTYKEPPYNMAEILRYAGCRDKNPDMLILAEECVNIVKGKLSYKVCYFDTQVTVNNDFCNFKVFSVKSKNLAKNLNGCENVIIFAATVGVEFDRLIARYKSISPSKAVMLQAIGAERVEALCDMFIADMEKELGVKVKPRYSPGYGDLPLDIQKDIFEILKCPKNIGVALSDSMLMLPSKSVTAFVGY